MNVSIGGGLPVTCLLSAGALRVVLRFVWVYGNWASFERYTSSAKPPLIPFVCVKLILLN